MKNPADRLPVYTKGRDPNKVVATDVYLLLFPIPNWVTQATRITSDGSNPAFSQGQTMGETAMWQIFGVDIPINIGESSLVERGPVNSTKGYAMVRFQLE